ncbi:peptidase M15 [Candidatus Nomurabacteria bacterium CG10_big_fil_rev_8_21_14_0_10_35_16]|uniref:Peptidase M15 n=1 Tax=Candidatus Nomurabacteria bacterium CG10_big_fil_rev_8_21_14_0_10_35_16 TaxID=1974731 RepID=A0A2H0TC93_9BACT|nr:MAG: peptidase M15 [Candidatus Nomurabacteria bacterium CG10_big_fil_rev_8_21_14_0_10_35_16]
MCYCFFVQDKIKNFVFSAFILGLIFIILIPYFSSYLLEKKQREENEIIYQELLAEQAIRLEKKYLTGKFDPAYKKDFVLIPLKYIYAGRDMYLRRETLDAFIKMEKAAALDGINLKIASATRNFDYQNGIWSRKWNGAVLVDGKRLSESAPSNIERFKKILEYSAAPSTSRHHWGTDIDINGADPIYFNSEKGIREYNWLVKNAGQFGFCQTYNEKGVNRENGYHEEKWHWSYLPIARELTQKYANLITIDDIKGFDGDIYARELNIIDDYVLSINPECL